MKSAFIAALCGLFLCATLTLAAGKPSDEIPPDLLLADRVEGPLSVAEITLRQRVDPPGLFLWEFLRDADTLSDARLRTLVHDLLRVRRFWREVSPADYILVDAWAERDLGAAAADMLAIPDWEDSIEPLGDSDSDTEDFAAVLWDRLARKDFSRALDLVRGLRGQETSLLFFDMVGSELSLPPDRLSEYVSVCEENPALNAPKLTGYAVVIIARDHGLDTARAALAALPEGPVKISASAWLDRWIADPWDGRPPANRGARDMKFTDNTLAQLAGLEVPFILNQSFAYPWVLVRAVRKLPAENAFSLAMQLARELQNEPISPCPWLGWALCMRAAEADPDASVSVAHCLPAIPADLEWQIGQIPGSGDAFTSVRFALRAGAPDTEVLLRALPPGPVRNEAVAGFFARASLTDSTRWVALAEELRVPAASWIPLLTRLAAAGRPEEALAMASKTDDPALIAGIVMEAWVLRDFPAAANYVMQLPESTASQPLARGFARALVLLRPAHTLPLLTPAVLRHLAALDGSMGSVWWQWIVIEDPGAVEAWLARYPGDEALQEAQAEWDAFLASVRKTAGVSPPQPPASPSPSPAR